MKKLQVVSHENFVMGTIEVDDGLDDTKLLTTVEDKVSDLWQETYWGEYDDVYNTEIKSRIPLKIIVTFEVCEFEDDEETWRGVEYYDVEILEITTTT